MKVAIIGGGVAGLYASVTAVEKGDRVTLWERRAIGEGIVCGECIFDTLDCMPAPSRGMLHPVEELLLLGKEEYRIPLGRYRHLWMMDRPLWQRSLAEHAVARGVDIRERCPVTPRDLAQLMKEYDWIIDASGAPSVTAKTFKFAPEYYRRYMVACQVKVGGDFSSIFPAVAAGFLPQMPPTVIPSYYWIFPQTKTRANVGFGLCSPLPRPVINPKRVLREVMVARGLSPLENSALIEGGLIPAMILPKLHHQNILLVGDAAGLASPLHGGGIDTAALSGVLAIAAIHEDLMGASTYQKRLVHALSNRLSCEDAFLHLLRTGGHEEWELLLRAAAGRAGARLLLSMRHPDLLWKAWRWLKRRRPTGLCSPALPWPSF